MRIAVASGKGGTGKTTVAVNLAVTAARAGLRTTYVDCDVEEPNGHIYLNPETGLSLPVSVEVPLIDAARCTGCGRCRDICAFRAIAVFAEHVMTFPELCHGCGGCFLVCPVDAIGRGKRPAGRVETGLSNITLDGGGRPEPRGNAEISFVQGILRVKEAMPLPVIREVKRLVTDSELVVVDCPPGNSCPMVESVRGADRVLLVTEPTPFGLSDLGIALETVREMDIPVDVILNRYERDRAVELSLPEEARITATIPESREMARIGSEGGIACLESAGFAWIMENILEDILSTAGGGSG